MATGKTKKSKRFKKTNKRNRSKYPALDVKLNLRTRTDLIDYDYLDKLNEKDKEWLNKFTEEYVNASFKKDKTKNIQNSKAHKKDSYDRNNARNRCIYTKSKAYDNLDYLEDVFETLDSREVIYEEKIIEIIDEERELLKKFNDLDNTDNDSGNGSNKSD